MKTAISIPDKLFRSADSLARRLKVSRSRLYATAVSEFLAKYQGRQITSQLNAVYDDADSSLSPRVMQLQLMSLPPEDW